MTTMMDALVKAGVVSCKVDTSNTKVLFTEECDQYFGLEMDKVALGQLIIELQHIQFHMDGAVTGAAVTKALRNVCYKGGYTA